MKIFLTGIGGNVGSEVASLLKESGHSVIGLLNSSPDITLNNGEKLESLLYGDHSLEPGQVYTLRGNISHPTLDISSGLYQRLLAEVDLVIHSAALTSFGRPLESYQQINVNGTRHMVDFCLGRKSGAIPLVQISTMYVCGEKPGIFDETMLDRNQVFGSPYEQSKYEAEKIVRKAEAENGLPVCIARPAIVVGHSKTGVMRKFDTIYTVYRITAAGLVRTIPGDYGATLDLVPYDWVAQGIVTAATSFEKSKGKTLHLSSDEPLSLREINDICAEFPSFDTPRFVPGHVFDGYKMQGLEAKYYNEVISLYESYFRRQVLFKNVKTKEVFSLSPHNQGQKLLRRIFQYAEKVGYFKRNNSTI